MEVKILCNCGQKFKFDIEPVGGRMPFAVNCPSCGVDGTAAANAILAQAAPTPPTPPTVATAVPVAVPATAVRVRINKPTPPTAPASATPPPPPVAAASKPMEAPRPISPVSATAAAPKPVARSSFAMGILGAVLGAGLGVGLMYGFYEVAGIRFPLIGIAIGALSGLGARLLYRGTDSSLGVVAGALSLIAVAGSLLLIGAFSIFSIISLVVTVSVAYQIASG